MRCCASLPFSLRLLVDERAQPTLDDLGGDRRRRIVAVVAVTRPSAPSTPSRPSGLDKFLTCRGSQGNSSIQLRGGAAGVQGVDCRRLPSVGGRTLSSGLITRAPGTAFRDKRRPASAWDRGISCRPKSLDWRVDQVPAHIRLPLPRSGCRPSCKATRRSAHKIVRTYRFSLSFFTSTGGLPRTALSARMQAGRKVLAQSWSEAALVLQVQYADRPVWR